MLIQSGANVNVINNKGNCALCPASEDGCTDVVRLLINNNACVNQQNNEGSGKKDYFCEPLKIYMLNVFIHMQHRYTLRLRMDTKRLWTSCWRMGRT